MKTKKIPIEEIEEGHIVAEDVFDIFGGLLLESGHELSAEDKSMMKTWGVRDVVVRDVETNIYTRENIAQLQKKDPGDRSDGSSSELQTRLDRKFAQVSDNPVMEKIKEMAVKILSGNDGSYE